LTHPVRVTDDFWDALDRELPSGRRPTWHDVATVDLPAIVDRFATGWDDLPQLIPGRPEYRILIVAGTYGIYSIEGQYAADGVVEIVGIELDFEGLHDRAWGR
jgi:hypothetical protein